jgi:hypothetical protein
MKDEKGLMGMFKELREALMRCDTRKLGQLILDDYVGFSLNGTIESKKDILENFKPGMTTISEYSVKDETVEVYDRIGIVTGKGTISGSYQGYGFLHHVLFTDIFKYDDGGWKYHKAQITEIKTE